MEPIAAARNKDLAPIVEWTESSPLNKTPVIVTSSKTSAESSGIESDGEKSTASAYSPTNSERISSVICDGSLNSDKKELGNHSHDGVKFIGIPDSDDDDDDDDDEKYSHCYADKEDKNKPKVPDGGWGWVIVASSFILSMIADGISFSFGLIYIELLDHFGESKSKTSWIGSLFMAVPLMSGPIMSALVDKYGCRKITILGGLVAGLGFILAAFSNTIGMLLLTFGTIAGLGLGMCYVTAVVSIAYWFDKKRSLAVSLGACGTGFGTFVYAPMTQHFIHEYGWRGCTLMLAGSFLNMCVCGAVMRDPDWLIYEQKKQNSHGHKSISGASSTVSISKLSGVGESAFPGVDELRHLMKSGESPEYILTTLATSIENREKLENIQEEKDGNHLYNSAINLPSFVKENEKVPLEVLELLSSRNAKLYNVILDNYPSLLSCRSCSENKLNTLPPNKHSTRLPVNMSMTVKPSRKSSACKTEDPTENLNRDMAIPINNNDEIVLKPLIKSPTSIKSPVKTQEPWLMRQFTSNQHYLRDLRMHRNSVMYRGAMMNIAKYKLRASSCPNIFRNSMININDDDEDKWYTQLLNTFKSMCDFKMFLEFHFLLMSLGTILLFICFIVPYFSLAEHMAKNGYAEDDGAMQISIIGITNTIGMIGFGWAGDQPWMNVTKCYAVCMAICGLSTLAYPLVIKSYWLLVLMSVLFGLSFASSFSFTPIILVELIPMERFTTAYGLILLSQGIGNLLGPPISGWLFDVTGSWDLSFYFAGIFTMISGILVGIIPFTKNFRIWGSAPLEKDLEKISQTSQKGSISLA